MAWSVTWPVCSTTQRSSERQSAIDAYAALGTPPDVPPKRSLTAALGNFTASSADGSRTFPQQQPAEKQARRPNAEPSETVGRPMSASRRKSMSCFLPYQYATAEAQARPP